MHTCTEPMPRNTTSPGRRPAIHRALSVGLITVFAAALLLAGCATTRHKTAAQEPEPTTASNQTQTTTTPSQDFSAALELMKNHQDQQAITAFQKLSQRTPKASGPFTNLGILHARAQHWDKAAQALHKAVALAPDNAVANNWLGIAQRHLGHYPQARSAYLKALSAKPDDANAHLNLGILYDQYLHQPANAIKEYQAYRKLQGSKSPDKDLIVAAWIKALQNGQRHRPAPVHKIPTDKAAAAEPPADKAAQETP